MEVPCQKQMTCLLLLSFPRKSKTSVLHQLKSERSLPSHHVKAIDSFSTKRYLQRKLKPNVTSEPMTDGGMANSLLLIGFHN